MCELACGQLYAAILQLSMSPLCHSAAVSCKVSSVAEVVVVCMVGSHCWSCTRANPQNAPSVAIALLVAAA